MSDSVRATDEGLQAMGHSQGTASVVHAPDPALQAAKLALTQAFVDAISAMPQVRRVMIAETAPPIRVWTVISAPPFDPAYRKPIYEAEMEVLWDKSLPPVDFRLVNEQELDDDLNAVLPTLYRVVFERNVA